MLAAAFWALTLAPLVPPVLLRLLGTLLLVLLLVVVPPVIRGRCHALCKIAKAAAIINEQEW